MSKQIQAQDTIKAEQNSTQIENERGRFDTLPEPEQQIEIDKWREVVGRDFPECLLAAELGLSVVAQLLIKDISNPFGLVFIGAASTGKTTTLSMFRTLNELIYTTDSFTSASLVSHASNRSASDLKKIDMLPKIRNRLVIVADLAPFFSDRKDIVKKNLGVMTRVFDGNGYESDSGVHGKRGYKGDYIFMFLAGSTPIGSSTWRSMGSMGNRWFFLNFESPDVDDTELADMLADDHYKEKLESSQTVTRNLILTLWAKNSDGVDWDKENDTMELRKEIARYSQLLAALRGTFTDTGSAETILEKPYRINQSLYNLARGHALACGRQNLTADDLPYCWSVALSSAPKNRVKALKSLVVNGGVLTTESLREQIGRSIPTAIKELDTLEALGIITIKRESDNKVGASKLKATVSERFAWLLEQSFEFPN